MEPLFLLRITTKRWGRVLAALSLFFMLEANAQALPTLFDHWHFFCSPSAVPSAKYINKMKARANSGGSKGAIAKFKYACLLHIYEINQNQTAFEKWQAGGNKGAQPVLNHRMSLGVLKQALGSLANLYKAKNKNPTALYYYGYALALSGDVEAVNRLDELMTDFNTSKYVPDAALVLGEFYFDNKDPQKAFREYNGTLKSKKQIIQLYTRYKQGWINYALGVDAKDQNKKKKAITDLVNVSKLAGESKSKLNQKLATQIKADLMPLLADFGNLEESRRILSAIGAKDVFATLVEQMAYAKLNAGDIKAAYNFFQITVKEDPMRAEAPVIMANMVRLAGQMNDVGLVANNLKLMIQNYIKDKKWRSVQKEPVLKKTDADVEAIVYEFSTIIDQQGRATGNMQFLASAQQLYGLFIKSFPKSSKILELRYFIAQIQIQSKQYLRGARMLYVLLKKNPKFPQAKEAAELMVTAAQFVIDNDKTVYKVPEPGTPLSPQKIPPNKKAYAESLDLFLKFQPRNQLAPVMDFTAASIYYDYGHFDKAIKRYYSYVKRYPTGDFAKPAAARILIYHQKQFDDDGMAKAKALFLSMPAFKSDPEMIATIKATDTIANQNKKTKAQAAEKKAAKNKADEASDEQEDDGQSETQEAIEASSPQDEDDET